MNTLRYIKEYWSRMEIKFTVISAHEEMEFVKKAMEDEEDDSEVNNWDSLNH